MDQIKESKLRKDEAAKYECTEKGFYEIAFFKCRFMYLHV